MSSQINDQNISLLEQLSGGHHAEYLFQVRGELGTTKIRVCRRRRKTLGIYVEKGTHAELRVPTWCAWQDICAFMSEKIDWVIRTERELSLHPSAPENQYEQGGAISYLGRQLTLELIKSQHKIVEQMGDKLTVSCSDPAKQHLVEKQVLDWYRRNAETLFEQRVGDFNLNFADDSQPCEVVVRKMRARWGSCARSGEICLNLWLIKQSWPQIDFVIAHELCHLRHFSHNKSFYGLLDQVMPDWRERETALGMAE